MGQLSEDPGSEQTLQRLVEGLSSEPRQNDRLENTPAAGEEECHDEGRTAPRDPTEQKDDDGCADYSGNEAKAHTREDCSWDRSKTSPAAD